VSEEAERGRVHHYRARCTWSGSTAAGYEHYRRSHLATSPPASATLELSSDPAFFGEAELLNPEQLVVLAASSCQLLSFLALCARARVDVVAYEDDAEAEMAEGEPPIRLSEIRLRPRIHVAPGTSHERVERLVELAHRECYVANSLATPVLVEATILTVELGA